MAEPLEHYVVDCPQCQSWTFTGRVAFDLISDASPVAATSACYRVVPEQWQDPTHTGWDGDGEQVFAVEHRCGGSRASGSTPARSGSSCTGRGQ